MFKHSDPKILYVTYCAYVLRILDLKSTSMCLPAPGLVMGNMNTNRQQNKI